MCSYSYLLAYSYLLVGNVRRQAIALEQDDLVQYQRKVYARDVARIAEWVDKDAQFLRDADDGEGDQENRRDVQVGFGVLLEIQAPGSFLIVPALLSPLFSSLCSCNCSPRN